ncbi:MAG: O-antigen ligase family protein [Candidatus Paceibacterota bacterium]|jgi:hypothetical protein
MNKEKTAQWMAILSLFLIPFNIKKFITLLIGNGEYFPLELSSAFLYLSEIFSIFFILFVIITKRKEFLLLCRLLWPLFLLLGISIISIAISDSLLLSIVSCVHLFFITLFTVAVATVIHSQILSVRDAMKVFAISALLQAEIAILQFVNQGSIGLHFFGEETINALTQGVAKIEVFGSIFIRSYGTFPHPNILGGFLVLGVIAWIYLFSSPSKRHGVFHRSTSLIGLFVVLLGLVFSFSRSAWIAAIVSFILCIIILFSKKEYSSVARELVLSGMIFGAILLGMVGWALVSRGTIKNDSAINERKVYTYIAVDMMGEYPFGVGIGNGIVRAEQEGRYDAYGLASKATHQPVHNIYLLIAEELGIVGVIVFLFFVGNLFVIKKQKTHLIDVSFLLVMFVSFLFIGLFDHYLLTLNAGRLMFFSILGIIAGLSLKTEKEPL